PSMSMAARTGGGQFAAMLTGLPGRKELDSTVALLVDRLSGRYFAGEEEIVLSTSAGVALAPADGLTAETMLQKAELAASEAGASGGGGVWGRGGRPVLRAVVASRHGAQPRHHPAPPPGPDQGGDPAPLPAARRG